MKSQHLCNIVGTLKGTIFFPPTTFTLEWEALSSESIYLEVLWARFGVEDAKCGDEKNIPDPETDLVFFLPSDRLFEVVIEGAAL